MKKILFVIATLVALAACQSVISQDWPRVQTWCNQWGYYFDGQKCEACKQNCQCGTYMTCDSCAPGYYKNSWGYCDTCQGFGMGVQACCDWSMGLEVNKSTIATSCYSTLNSGLTTVMQTGGVCSYISWCTAYDDYGTCTSCSNGYYLSKDKLSCQPCISNCATCSGPGQCSTCPDGTYLNAYVSGQNLKNTPTSTTFQVNNASVCSACNSGCKCSDYTNLCTSCLTSYYQDSSSPMTCKLCSSVLTNCMTCSSSSTCSSCYNTDQTGSSKYVNLIGGTCVICPQNCYTCSSSTVCTGCINGYYLDSTGNCQNCNNGNNNVLLCSGTDGKQYSQCMNDSPGTNATHQNVYYLVTVNNNLTCVKNQYNCKQMKSPTVDTQGYCSSCYTDLDYLPGFDTNNMICFQCQNVSANCAFGSCIAVNSSQIANCTKCQAGFFLNNGQCSACSTGCVTCSSSTTCTQCMAGYQLKSGSCNQCTQSNCIQCDNDVTVCQACQIGYRLQTYNGGATRCETCDANCLMCSSNRKQCTMCQWNYYVNTQGGCSWRKSNCAVFDSSGRCSKCYYGYRIVDGSCFTCNNKGDAYINCQNSCDDTMSYRRDGVYYTAEAEAKRQEHAQSASFLIVSLSAILCIIAFIF